MVNELGVGLGLVLTLVVVAMHFSRGPGWSPTEDISEEVIEHRAASVPETDFPEPMNRSIGGGAVAAAAAVEGEAGAELEGSAGPDADAEVTEDPSAIPDEEAETFEIEYTKEGETVEVKENETLLEAGEDEGWDLPYACREGQCLSCCGRVTDGGSSEDSLEHHTNEMLGQAEVDEGYTLTCVAYPISDLSLETSETP